MKREDLTAKGLTAEQVDYVMAEYGKELNPMKAERDSYKAQLDTAQASLKAMEGIDAAGLQTKVTELTNQLKGKDTEIEKIRSDYTFDSAVRDAIRKASGRNEKAIMALLDMDSLRSSKNQKEDVEKALKALAEAEDSKMLFGEPETKPTGTQSIIGAVTKSTETAKETLGDALAAHYKN